MGQETGSTTPTQRNLQGASWIQFKLYAFVSVLLGRVGWGGPAVFGCPGVLSSSSTSSTRRTWWISRSTLASGTCATTSGSASSWSRCVSTPGIVRFAAMRPYASRGPLEQFAGFYGERPASHATSCAHVRAGRTGRFGGDFVAGTPRHADRRQVPPDRGVALMVAPGWRRLRSISSTTSGRRVGLGVPRNCREQPYQGFGGFMLWALRVRSRIIQGGSR